MQATRQEILDYLRRAGDGTVRDLVELVGMTATGLRQHLTVLKREGLIEIGTAHGRVGRPALVYSLTQAGYALFPSRYDDLSNLLLEEIRSILGAKGLQNVLMQVAARSAKPYENRLNRKSFKARVQEAAQIINERGSVADIAHSGGEEYQINQYTCPYSQVARTHSCICTLEVEFVRRLTGGDVRLVQSLLRGDKCCSYRVRPPRLPD